MSTTSQRPIAAPATFIPESAMNFADTNGGAVRVSGASPLPATLVTTSAVSAALVGTASASGAAGPFTPDLGRSIRVTLSGTWAGTVQLLRAVDGGTSRLSITIGGQPWGSITANANEVVTEESETGASYWLAITLQSGTVSYRVAQ